MIYTFKNNTISILEDGARILQSRNPITNKEFTNEQEAVEWASNHLSYLGKYIDLSFNNQTYKSTYTTKDIELGSIKLCIRATENDEIVYDSEISKDAMTTFNMPREIENGEYYVDFKFDNAFCLINKDKAIIQNNKKKK